MQYDWQPSFRSEEHSGREDDRNNRIRRPGRRGNRNASSKRRPPPSQVIAKDYNKFGRLVTTLIAKTNLMSF